MKTHGEHRTEHQTFEKPDEIREFPRGRAEILKLQGGDVGRLVFQPGWRWSNDVKPIAKTTSCEAPHFQYHVTGKLAIRMRRAEMAAAPTACAKPAAMAASTWARSASRRARLSARPTASCCRALPAVMAFRSQAKSVRTAIKPAGMAAAPIA